MSEPGAFPNAVHALSPFLGGHVARDVISLFDKAVARSPDRPLWQSLDDDDCLTYREFATKTQACAAMLEDLELGPGRRLGLCLPNVPAFMITWLAAARIGATVVPLNIGYTSFELAGILARADIDLLVIDVSLADKLSDDVTAIVGPDRTILHGSSGKDSWHGRVGACSGQTVEVVRVDETSVATIQFTSGSTGQPKGCVLPHGYWTLLAYNRAGQGPAVERLLIDMPFHYMGGQWRFLMAIHLGSTAVVALKPSLHQMVGRLVRHDIDFCSVSSLMIKVPEDPQSHALRLKWAGTMVLPGELHRDLEQRLNGAPVREMYGLTETGAVLAMPFDAKEMVGSGMIGKVVPYRQCRIVKPDGADASHGEAGELLVSGPGMMLGYFNDPAATQAAFDGEWFRTGDLFTCDEHGFYRIVGRLKDVIRRSGENISATEVEYAASAMPAVQEAAAVAVPDEHRGEEVKLFVVLREGFDHHSASPQDIRDFCAQRLSSFKLPRYVAYVATLPKTASGKVAKHELKGAVNAHGSTYDVVNCAWLSGWASPKEPNQPSQ